MLALALAAAAAASWAQSAQAIKAIEIRGNKNISAAAIQAAMTRLQVGRLFVRADADADEDAVANLGFFRDVSIITREASPSEVNVIVDVFENPVINEIRVTGNSVISSEKLTELILKEVTMGQVWNNNRARTIRTQIEEAYAKEETFAQLLALEPDEAVPGALLVSILEPKVGEIAFVGLTRTQESTVRRMIKTKPGEVLRLGRWRNDLLELLNTQWFEKIEPEPPTPTDQPGVFNLKATVKEARTAQVGAGVAVDPQSRLVGNVFYSETNFRGLGQSLGVNLSQSAVGGGPSAEIGFSNRFFDAKDTTFNAQIFSKVQYNFVGSGTGAFGSSGQNDFNERRTGLSLQWNRPVGRVYRAGFGVTAQNIKTIELNQGLNNTEFIQQDGDLAYLQFNFDYDARQPSVEPFQGRFFRIQVEPGYSNITKLGGSVAGDTGVLGANTFVRTTVEYRHYWSRPLKQDEPFDKPRPVLAFRARYGHITGTVPFFEQFFLGGSNSLRGYDNQRFWGSQSFLSSVEYRFPIQRAFNLIGFVDYGGAWNGYGKLRDFTQSDSIKLQLGYGVGASFRTPFGPVRIDFGFNEKGSTRTHFAFGTSF